MEELMHHLQMSKGQIGKYVILPGDPGRVEKIASFLDNPYYVQTSREYTTYNGYIDGELVTVMSTGMGGPSTAIAVEELKMLGAEYLIRVGTCGGLDPSIVPGTLMISTGAIRKEGTTREYAPIEYPAVPDFELTGLLKQACINLNYKYAMGVSESKDSYYGQHAPQTMPTKDELIYKWNAWSRCGAIASEMEGAALFIVSSVRKLKAAAIFLLCSNQQREAELGIKDPTCFDTTEAIKAAIEAFRLLIKKEKNEK